MAKRAKPKFVAKEGADGWPVVMIEPTSGAGADTFRSIQLHIDSPEISVAQGIADFLNRHVSSVTNPI